MPPTQLSDHDYVKYSATERISQNSETISLRSQEAVMVFEILMMSQWYSWNAKIILFHVYCGTVGKLKLHSFTFTLSIFAKMQIHIASLAI